MKLVTYGSILVLSLAIGRASASDLAFGARHLPQLVESAKLVVVVNEAHPLAGGSTEAALFELTAQFRLKGILPPSKKLTALTPTVDRHAKAADFVGAAVFLRGPLSAAELSEWGVSVSGDVYQVIAAGSGLVALNEGRLGAIEDYISAADAPAGTNVKMKWAERQLKTNDDFLQTSAVFEIERQKDKERALKTLSSVVRSDGSTLTARKLAVRVLSDSPAAKATGALRDAAENRRIPDLIRRDAVAGVKGRADGEAVLEKWKGSRDALLSSEAQRLSEKKKE